MFWQKAVLVFLILLFASCGYRPSAKYARLLIGHSVSTEIIISKEDPENSVLVKDAVDAALVDLLHTSLATKEQSDTHLEITLAPPSYTPIQYDQNGFVVAYRMQVTLGINYRHKGASKYYRVKGYYDFAVEPNAVVTDQQRFEAIRNAAQKAIISFIAQISSQGARSE